MLLSQYFPSFNVHETIAVSLILFTIIDALGSIPIFINFKNKTNSLPPLKTTFFSSVFMIVFLLAGKHVLSFFSITIEDFSSAGAVILFILGIEMLLDIQIFKLDITNTESALLTPLVFPIIVGPGVFATLLALQAKYASINIVLALFINLCWVYFVLRYVSWIQKIIGKTATSILHKVMGILVLSIAIGMFKANFFRLV